MTSAKTKRLRMFAGPNGSGKSSIIRTLAREWSAAGLFWLNHYLNADDLERALLSTGLDLAAYDLEVSLPQLLESLQRGGRLSADHSFFAGARMVGSLLSAPRADGYLAAALVDFFREELLRRGDSFSFETVMSHHQKIVDFMRARNEGYKTYLYFVCTNSAELNVARVRFRVGTGGHAVPEDKIRDRYKRSLELAHAAVEHAYRAYFFDNSGQEPIWLAEFDPLGHLHLKFERESLPGWFSQWLDARSTIPPDDVGNE